jgi:DNA-binding MarR family transcriptional regulator
MIFNLLKRLNELEKVAVPFIWTKVDRDVLIAIGAAQEEGNPLGLKQLILLDLGADATLRRRLRHLLDSGYVEKVTHQNDRRKVVYVVSRPIRKYMEILGRELLRHAEAGTRKPQ